MQRISVTKTFSSSDTSLVYGYVGDGGDMSVGDIFYVDAIQIELGSSATQF